MERDGVTGRRRSPDAQHPRDVLPEVETDAPIVAALDGDGASPSMTRTGGPVGRNELGAERGRGEHPRALHPGRRTQRRPPGALEPSVVGSPSYSPGADRRLADATTSAARRAVRAVELELQQQRQVGAVVVPYAAVESEAAAVPAVGEPDAERVRPSARSSVTS